MASDVIEKMRLGMNALIPILDSLDFTEDSHQYQFASILEYWGIFTTNLLDKKEKKDPELAEIIDLYSKFTESFQKALDRRILSLSKKIGRQSKRRTVSSQHPQTKG